jgi:cyclophilin family peptidyl-prolyl cis-trans isomerase
MPTEKRARKRAAREAKQAAMQRAQRRRSTVRRTITVIIAVAVAAGIYLLVSSGSSPKKSAGSSTTISSTTSSTSTTSTSTTTTTLAPAQATADQVAVAAGCPSSPATALPRPKYAAPPMTIDTTKTYTATVKTDVGTFVITLDAKASPVAVNSFVFLAQKGFFNCVIFHRVIPNFVVQGGDPTGLGTGGSGYSFTESGPKAAANPAQQYPLGSVAMANSNQPATTRPTTNGSQFFIVTGSSGESLMPDYVLFGQVTSGMNVVDQISNDGSSSGVPPTITHRMLTVTIAES